MSSSDEEESGEEFSFSVERRKLQVQRLYSPLLQLLAKTVRP